MAPQVEVNLRFVVSPDHAAQLLHQALPAATSAAHFGDATTMSAIAAVMGEARRTEHETATEHMQDLIKQMQDQIKKNQNESTETMEELLKKMQEQIKH